MEELCTCANEADYICSVAWSSDGSYLALGTSDAKVCGCEYVCLPVLMPADLGRGILMVVMPVGLPPIFDET